MKDYSIKWVAMLAKSEVHIDMQLTARTMRMDCNNVAFTLH